MKRLLAIAFLFTLTTSVHGLTLGPFWNMIGGVAIDPGAVSNETDSVAIVVISWAGSTDSNEVPADTPSYGATTTKIFFYLYDDDDNPTVKDMYDSLEATIPDLDFVWWSTNPNILYNVKWGDQRKPDEVWEGGASGTPLLQDRWVIDALHERMKGPANLPKTEWYWNKDIRTVNLNATAGFESKLLKQKGTGMWHGGVVKLHEGFKTHILRIDPDTEGPRLPPDAGDDRKPSLQAMLHVHMWAMM